MANDHDISERLGRVEAIIEQFDTDEYDSDEGKELYDEGQRLLAEVRDILCDGSGNDVKLE